MTTNKTIEDRYDSNGYLIKEHDVLKDIKTNEIAIVIKDWLDIYPDGVWEVIGNLSTVEGQ